MTEISQHTTDTLHQAYEAAQESVLEAFNEEDEKQLIAKAILETLTEAGFSLKGPQSGKNKTIEMGSDSNPIQVSIGPAGINTMITYYYRGQDSKSRPHDFILPGRLSLSEIQDLVSRCNTKIFKGSLAFIPNEIGLEDISGEVCEEDENDGPWHELISVGYTDRKPSEAKFNKDQFMLKLLKVPPHWNERDY